MNLKRVLYLIRVDMKSGRLLRGQKLVKYNVNRNKLFRYLPYAITIAIGVAIGLLLGYFYNSTASEATMQTLFNEGFMSFQFSLPTLMLVITIVFTMLQQIQRSGITASTQIPYWLPVTWQEHTLASIVAEVLSLPSYAIALISPAILIFAFYTGQIPLAVGAVLAMIAAAFMGSALIEIFRILQVRFIGAVYKSTGRGAVYVRFAGSILFFIIFYIIYFYLVSGANALYFIQTVASAQNAMWFVPFVWLGLTLFSAVNGLVLQGVSFMILSICFIICLFLLGAALNARFGLYEPPAITISRGTYTPKTGLLGKFGFSPTEAALIRKDLRAFTRRRELISAFIVPIVCVIVPIMSSAGALTKIPPSELMIFVVMAFLLPVGLMSLIMGNFMIGEEGQSMWRIYSSPISAKNLVKSKYSFMVFFPLIILPITGIIGSVLYQPSLQAIIALTLAAIFLIFALSALSLSNGIKGADFTVAPRPRMIRTSWSLINMLTCGAAALAILAPMILYGLPGFLELSTGPFIDLYLAVIISGIIAMVLTVVFYTMAVNNAKELLTKAEV